jgi:hypothetical protein
VNKNEDFVEHVEIVRVKCLNVELLKAVGLFVVYYKILAV